MKNEYKIIGENKDKVLIFANCKGKVYKVLIDLIDLEKVDKATKGSWYVKSAKGTFYALFCIRRKGCRDVYVQMHRLIVGLIICIDDTIINSTNLSLVPDHDPVHYGLDNRRCNLTVVSYLDNLRNQKR